MNRFIIRTICFFTIFNFIYANSDELNTSRAQVYEYKVIWEDNFDGNSLDMDSWNIEPGGSSNWNNTAVNDPRVIEVSDGTLKLKAIKNPNYTGSLSSVVNINDESIWTGAVDTRLKVDFKYGKVEVRARMESVPRAWPAIWLMPTYSVYGGNPNSGEIDMVERLNEDSYFYSTIHTEYHWKASNGKSDPERYTTEPATDLDQWAVYTLEWDENKIEFYRNGNKYHTFNKGENVTVGGYLRWPFDEEFYIILSQQIGGGWVDGEASSQGLVLEDSDLPYELEIDYVRVSQKQAVSINKNFKNVSINNFFTDKKFSVYRTSTGNIKLSESSNWVVYDLSGKVIKEGLGDIIPFTKESLGCYLIKTKFGTAKLNLY